MPSDLFNQLAELLASDEPIFKNRVIEVNFKKEKKMESFTFYKDNRIDGAYEVLEADLRSRFLKWFASQNDHKVMLEQMPYNRIVQQFILVAGHIENSQYNEAVATLKDSLINCYGN